MRGLGGLVSLTEAVVVLIIRVMCLAGLVVCAVGLWRVQKRFGDIIDRLNHRIALNEGKHKNQDS